MTGLRQRDGVSCGPSVAVVAGAMIDPVYGAKLADAGWFAAEQGRIHAQVNRIWPRRLGVTPAAIARALSTHRPYRWRLFHGRRDTLGDVRVAVGGSWPVAMLIGNVLPRHWVLLVALDGDEFRCYEPSSGEQRTVGGDAIRRGSLLGLGYPRPWAFVLPFSRLERGLIAQIWRVLRP